MRVRQEDVEITFYTEVVISSAEVEIIARVLQLLHPPKPAVRPLDMSEVETLDHPADWTPPPVPPPAFEELRRQLGIEEIEWTTVRELLQDIVRVKDNFYSDAGLT